MSASALASIVVDLLGAEDGTAFLLAMFLLPALGLLWQSARVLERILRAGATFGGWWALCAAYVAYRNHPWFAGQETWSCDGPCFGWYSFENEWTELLPLLGLLSLASGSVALLAMPTRSR
jgi:hypothetical protein